MNMKIREYENTHMNNRANLHYHVLIQVNMMPILNVTIVYDELKHSQEEV